MDVCIDDGIIYDGLLFPEEVNRLQIVYKISGNYIHTKFVDNDSFNIINILSPYYECNCELIKAKDIAVKYDNGIPLVWGDD
jgi:hypothetical protein